MYYIISVEFFVVTLNMLYYHILIWFFKKVLYYKTSLKSHICYEIRRKNGYLADYKVLSIY